MSIRRHAACLTFLTGQVTEEQRPAAPGLEETRWRKRQYEARLEKYIASYPAPEVAECAVARRILRGIQVRDRLLPRWIVQRVPAGAGDTVVHLLRRRGGL